MQTEEGEYGRKTWKYEVDVVDDDDDENVEREGKKGFSHIISELKREWMNGKRKTIHLRMLKLNTSLYVNKMRWTRDVQDLKVCNGRIHIV